MSKNKYVDINELIIKPQKKIKIVDEEMFEWVGIFEIEERLNNQAKRIFELESEVEKLEHRLANCIEPKFKIGQEIWDIITQRYWEIKKFELIPLEGELCEMYRLGHGDTGDYNSCLLPYDGNQFFATEEEAIKHLEKIQDGN